MLSNMRKKIKNHQRGLIDEQFYSEFAVLVPLLQDVQGQWQVLFEVRSRSLKGQPGEICFPGGGIEQGDASELETATRETCEELRVSKSSIEIWGGLDILFTPFQFIIYPFVGVLGKPEEIDPNRSEVEEVFTLPLITLLKTVPEYHEVPVRVHPGDDFPFNKIPRGKEYHWRTGLLPEYFYEIEGRVIWGITARILTNFLEIIGSKKGKLRKAENE